MASQSDCCMHSAGFAVWCGVSELELELRGTHCVGMWIDSREIIVDCGGGFCLLGLRRLAGLCGGCFGSKDDMPIPLQYEREECVMQAASLPHRQCDNRGQQSRLCHCLLSVWPLQSG